jgi:dihydrofolate reductase
MRKITVFNRMSLDGAYAAADNKMDWFIQDPALDRASHEILDIDTLILGRTSYKELEANWPRLAADPNAPKALRMIGEEMNNLKKIVFSTTLNEVTWENSELHKGDLPQEVRKIKRRTGRNIAIFGSGTVVKQLAAEGLIDEYLLIVTPVVLGTGKSLFGNDKEQALTLVESRVSDTGNTMNHYVVAQRPRKATPANRSSTAAASTSPEGAGWAEPAPSTR